MAAYYRIELKVYCDGAFHYPLQLTVADTSQATLKRVLSECGWVRTRDAKTYCSEHRP